MSFEGDHAGADCGEADAGAVWAKVRSATKTRIANAEDLKMPSLCGQLMCTRTECESYNISPLRALKAPCPETYAYWVIRVLEVRVVYHFIGWRARRLRGVHRSGLAGVAAMRHRTMDVGPGRSTIDWLILSQ